ncbi:MAG: c-type cytochrome [Pseudohongiellaceae bacterium]
MVRQFSTHSGKWLLAVFVLIFSGALFAADDDIEDIIERISPPGSVCLIGDACAGGATVASAGGAGSGPSDPVQIYNTYCVACHGSGANNAPVLGDAAMWQPRLEKGMDTLYENAINGLNNNAMPAKGLCMACSDEAIMATVDYLVDSVQ